MTVFNKLKRATEVAQSEQDLPDFLADRILLIIARPDECHAIGPQLEDLAEMVCLYDTYGQIGLGAGVNHVILEKSLERIEALQASA